MASKGSIITTDLFSATRQGCSVNGNPRFDLHTSDGTYRTQSDAGISYEVYNIVRTIPRGETIPVILHTTPAGRVWNIIRADVETARDHDLLTLAEVRNGTGWAPNARFRPVHI
jgi:hypothetical protein